jgi:hypothetical protein
MMIAQAIWPHIFITGEIPEKITREDVVVAGLSGWGCAQIGADMPVHFGETMVKIGKFLGILATQENLMKEADKIIKEKKDKKDKAGMEILTNI